MAYPITMDRTQVTEARLRRERSRLTCQRFALLESAHPIGRRRNPMPRDQTRVLAAIDDRLAEIARQLSRPTECVEEAAA